MWNKSIKPLQPCTEDKFILKSVTPVISDKYDSYGRLQKGVLSYFKNKKEQSGGTSTSSDGGHDRPLKNSNLHGIPALTNNLNHAKNPEALTADQHGEMADKHGSAAEHIFSKTRDYNHPLHRWHNQQSDMHENAWAAGHNPDPRYAPEHRNQVAEDDWVDNKGNSLNFKTHWEPAPSKAHVKAYESKNRSVHSNNVKTAKNMVKMGQRLPPYLPHSHEVRSGVRFEATTPGKDV